MPAITTRTRAQGASIITTLPAEIIRRLGIRAGDELAWMEDGLGGFRVVPNSPQLERVTEVHERAMQQYDGVFRKLAE
jgi:bifunctional DNA-binding transcriptional regulator/antitoxin component of YhaV-PrlF toxin-antitoxin module